MKFDRVYIEISNICNLQCDFCPEVERTKKIMSFELFQKIIDQLQGLTQEVTFHLMGEPLAHPQFTEFLNYCAKVKMPVNLTTNGTLLHHKNRAQVLLNPIIRQINFSIQSYISNFPHGDLKSYMQTLFDFTRQAFVDRPDLYINYRLWNYGSREETQTQNAHFFNIIENEFSLQINREVDVGFRKSKNILNRLYLHFDSRFEWPSLKGPRINEKGFCYALKSHFAIHADGTVVPCCLDKEAGIPLGSALDLLSTLRSERARSLRQGFDNFMLSEELCRRCDFIKRFSKKKYTATQHSSTPISTNL